MIVDIEKTGKDNEVILKPLILDYVAFTSDAVYYIDPLTGQTAKKEYTNERGEASE